jgi:hypothetical protein
MSLIDDSTTDAAAAPDTGTAAAPDTGTAAAPDTGTAAPDTGTAEQPSWMFAENTPGAGDRPEWFKHDKYGTVADQAKAYKELESRFGSFTGAPEKYEINLGDELRERGVDITEDDPLYQEAIKFAKDSNMNQEGFAKMMNLYAMAQVAEIDALEHYKTEQMRQLGDNAKARVTNLDNWGKANLPGDLYEGFKEMAASATAVKALEKIVSLTRNAPISPSNVQPNNGISADEVRRMQFEKDEFGNRRIQTDPDFKARYNKLKEQVWGSEDHRIIINS